VGVRVTMSREARARFLGFATSAEARWPGNFRDFNAAVVRMATLAPGGRVGLALVDEELARLREAWSATPSVSVRAPAGEDPVTSVLGGERAASLDRFERVQLADVLRVCRSAPSLSAAGRVLFASSRAQKRSANDADRLRKYLARYGIEWKDLQPPSSVDGADPGPPAEEDDAGAGDS
jgi:transcriptional regulatory protein RtcR